MFKLLKNLKFKDFVLVIVAVALIVLQVALELKIPDFTRNLTEIVQSGTMTGTANMSDVWKNGGLMLACAAGSLFSAVICTFLLSRVASSFSKTLRDKLYEKISTFSEAEMKKFSVPSLITRTTNDVVQMQNFMAMGIQLVFKAPIMAVWAILKISETNIKWTIAVAVSVVLIVVGVVILTRVVFPRFKRIQKLTDEINTVTRESVSGVRVVRAFGAEDFQEQKFDEVNKKITNNHLVTSRTLGLMNPMMNLVMNGLMLAIYWIGAVLVNQIVFSGDVQAMIIERGALVGSTAAFTSYAMQVVMSFMMLIMIFIVLPRTLVSAKRILEVLETQPSIVEGCFNGEPENHGTIEFKNVSFSYADSENAERAIADVSFKVATGETLAIIGATGSAKSTLIKLIPRFHDATQGTVLVDGVCVKDYREEVLNSKIAFAAQKAVLFKGTIRDNIALGSEIVDDEKIKEALRIAQADFVFELEKGLDSEVAQGGTNFSGGQKQRLSIARALYKNAEIIIFDDTFSALDYKTDMLVRSAIHENLAGKTIVIVAQRIGTIKDADQILVLDEGKVVGKGTHKELLENCALYKEIALSQLSKEELE
ncbi:MAG: ABC transporter ATP-binding protein [Clostridia bacterium]|nr:ABC transporter ATP-binding protein [Clostridia bacterium]